LTALQSSRGNLDSQLSDAATESGSFGFTREKRRSRSAPTDPSRMSPHLLSDRIASLPKPSYTFILRVSLQPATSAR